MKRTVAFVLCLLLLAFSGCGESSESRREREAEIAESAYDEGYNDGYDNGYDDGKADDRFATGTNNVPDDWVYNGEYIVWQETPKSTCFSYVGYDSGFEVLALIFRDNPTRTYLYSEFLMMDYRAFMAADSLGGYYNKNIKGEYPCERIDNPAGTYFEP